MIPEPWQQIANSWGVDGEAAMCACAVADDAWPLDLPLCWSELMKQRIALIGEWFGQDA